MEKRGKNDNCTKNHAFCLRKRTDYGATAEAARFAEPARGGPARRPS